MLGVINQELPKCWLGSPVKLATNANYTDLTAKSCTRHMLVNCTFSNSLEDNSSLWKKNSFLIGIFIIIHFYNDDYRYLYKAPTHQEKGYFVIWSKNGDFLKRSLVIQKKKVSYWFIHIGLHQWTSLPSLLFDTSSHYLFLNAKYFRLFPLILVSIIITPKVNS